MALSVTYTSRRSDTENHGEGTESHGEEQEFKLYSELSLCFFNNFW